MAYRYTNIKLSEHRAAGYSPAKNMQFAENDIAVPIVLDELLHIAASMTICFQKTSSNDVLELVALQSLKPNSNAYVLPNGRWLPGYVPSYYRGYPFALSTGERSNELSLSVDECMLKLTADVDDVPFFDGEELSERLKNITDFLVGCLKSRQLTLELCKQLIHAGLVVEWPIKYIEAEETKVLNGFYKIDADKLQMLSAAELFDLNASGALRLAYAQVFSTVRVNQLIKLYAAKQKNLEKNNDEEPDLDNLFGNGEDVLSF